MSDQVEIKNKVNEYAEITKQIEALKLKADDCKAWFELEAQATLLDTKDKTVTYWGTDKAKVTVTNAETVKPVAMSVLKDLLQKTYDDFVKEEIKYTFKEPCKTFLQNMFLGNYVESSLLSEIDKITLDPKVKTMLVKKLKGKYQQDKANLIKLAELSEAEASDTAYLIQEVMTYEKIKGIIEASGFKGSFDEAVAKIKASLIVDVSIKVTLDKA